jgi:hypothetical protein
MPPSKPPAPIWQPPESLPERPTRVEHPFPVHIHACVQKYCPHRPPVKAMVDSLRLDGASEEKIRKMRNFYAKENRDSEKNQRAIEKMFGKYSAKTKTPKKVVKIVKKRNVL